MHSSNVIQLFPQQPKALPCPLPGQVAQCHGWPENDWAEVVSIHPRDNSVMLLRYSDCGNNRLYESTPLALLSRFIDKRDIPLDHFITGSVDLIEGKLGRISVRWSATNARHRWSS